MAIDAAEILRQLDEQRRTVAAAGETLETVGPITRARSADGSHHWIIHSSLAEEDADAIIAREVAHYRRLGVRCEWKLFAHDAPGDLKERLRRHGFEIGPLEAVMVFNLSQSAAWIHETNVSNIVRIDREDQIADFRRVAEAVFRKDYTFTSNELTAALAEGSTNHRGYVAYVDGKPASIGRLYTHPASSFGGLNGGGTLAEFRGRGLYRAVVAARARDAIRSGAKYLMVDALPTSRPILERLGFERLTDTWPCELKPG